MNKISCGGFYLGGGVKLVDKALVTDNTIEILNAGTSVGRLVSYDSIMKYIDNGIDAFPAIVKFYQYDGIIKNLKHIDFKLMYIHPSIYPDQYDFDMLINDSIDIPYTVSSAAFQFSLSDTVTIGSDKYIKLVPSPK